MSVFRLMIPDYRPTDVFREVQNPWDESVLAKVEIADEDTVERAIATAHDLYRNRNRWLSKAERIRILEATRGLMLERREELATGATLEGGKPLADSFVEVARAIDCVRISIDLIRNEGGTEIPMNIDEASSGRVAYTHHEPVGVVLAYSAFNHPLNLIAHQIMPAIAAGCPVIVKPAEATPLSCLRLVGILHEAGLPEEFCQAITTQDRDLAGKLASDPRIGFFSFIGSATVGWMLRGRLAPGTRCTLEHGGAAPTIVAADADLEPTADLIAKGGFYHAGQVCVSTQRVFVDDRVLIEFCDLLKERVKALKVGDPLDLETDVGPLIRRTEVSRVGRWTQEAIDGGAKLICGGREESPTVFAPTILLSPPPDALVSKEEIFGPVVTVQGYGDLTTAISDANAVDYAFQAAVFTTNLDTALRASRGLNASAVFVNDHTAFRVDWMPFAGLGKSGLGTGGIPYSFREMQIDKMTVIRSNALKIG